MLNHSCIPGTSPMWSWCTLLFLPADKFCLLIPFSLFIDSKSAWNLSVHKCTNLKYRSRGIYTCIYIYMYVYIYICIYIYAIYFSGGLVAKSHSTLCNPIDSSPPIFSGHGIFQARILEWVAISSSRGSSRPRDWTRVSCVPCLAGRFFTTEPPRKPCNIYVRCTHKKVLY